MADIALAQRTVQIYEGALSTAQQDLTAQQNIQTSFQNKANALNDKAAGLPNGSDEQQATLEKAANYQSQANNQAQFITRAQDNVDNAQSQLDYAKQELVTAQQQQDTASSQTATDAVADKTTNPAPATQNTGTDSSETGTALTPTEQAQVASGNKQTADVVAPNGINSATAIPSGDDSAQFIPSGAPTTKVGPTVGADILNIVDSINPNPLSDYASYTYNLNLHVLTAEDYHTLVNDPTNFTPTRNLISGANRYFYTSVSGEENNFTTKRDPAFADDFYFEELKIKTIIGLNATSAASNAIEINFSIIEPYGMTLLDRILDINNNELDAKNYLEMPYLLEINFFGNDDGGNPQLIPNTTKFIPIKIIGFKIKASVKGSEYTIQAIPFNHQATFSSSQDIKANFGVTASTVGSFFASGALTAEQLSAIDAAYSDTQREAPSKGKDEAPPTGARTPSSATDPNKNKAIIIGTGTSLTEAINAWNLKLATNGLVDYADKINFIIDEEISESSITDPAKNDVNNTAPVTPQTVAASTSAQASGATLPDPQTKYDTSAVAGAGSDTGAYFGNPHITAQGQKAGATNGSRVQVNATTDPRSLLSADGGDAAIAGAQTAVANPTAPSANVVDFGNSMFHLNAGTKIMQIIDMVMMNSQYILKQLQTPELKSKSVAEQQAAMQSAGALAEALNAKEVKWYKVIPEVHLDEFDHSRNVWGKTITYNIQTYTYHNNRHPDMPKTPPPPAVKNYQYLYTGQNTEVLGFDIEYNALYYTALQANRGNTTDLTDTKAGEEGDKGKTSPNPTKTSAPEKIEFKGGNASASTGLGWARAEVQAAHNVMQSFYSEAGGDMIALKLQILGDPQFIKQDDIYYSPGAIKKLNLRDEVFVNGSLATDNGELYCTITFNTPVDIDESTGLLRKDSKYYVSYFSGYYRVLTVDSEFRGGKFVQTLELIRYPNQTNSGQPASTASSYDAERNDDAGADAQFAANPAQPGGKENLGTPAPPTTPLANYSLAPALPDTPAYTAFSNSVNIPSIAPADVVASSLPVDYSLASVATNGLTTPISQTSGTNTNSTTAVDFSQITPG